jgi:hypothetical protein
MRLSLIVLLDIEEINEFIDVEVLSRELIGVEVFNDHIFVKLQTILHYFAMDCGEEQFYQLSHLLIVKVLLESFEI